MKLNIVPARAGIQWVKLGVKTFLRQPLALAGLFFMFTMGMFVLSVIPLIGPVAAVILMPAATLGMMAATAEAAQGRFPMPWVLVSAFRAGQQRAKAMLILGAIYAVVLLVIVMLTSLLVAPIQPSGPPATSADAAVPAEAHPALFVALALQLPFAVLFAHAPALVHWYGVSPVKSLFFSAVAFWRNLGAFLMFGAAWLAFMFAAGAVLSLVFALFGATPTPQAMAPVALLMLAMMSTSMYFTFRDSFVPDSPTDNNPEEPPHE